MTWRTGPKETQVTTTSASRHRRPRVRDGGGGPDPANRGGVAGERRGAFRVAIVDGDVDAGQEVAEHRQVRAPLDAGAHERRARPPARNRR